MNGVVHSNLDGRSQLIRSLQFVYPLSKLLDNHKYDSYTSSYRTVSYTIRYDKIRCDTKTISSVLTSIRARSKITNVIEKTWDYRYSQVNSKMYVWQKIIDWRTEPDSAFDPILLGRRFWSPQSLWTQKLDFLSPQKEVKTVKCEKN